MPGGAAGSQQHLGLEAVVTKIKDNDIHLQISPSAEHSRKTFHKDLKILFSPCFWPKGVYDDPTLCNLSLRIKVTQGPSQMSG